MTSKNHPMDHPELSKLIELLNSAQNMRMQLATFFGASAIITLGVALSEQKLIILALVMILALLYMYADRFLLRGLYGYYVRALIIIRNEFESIEESIFDMFKLYLVKNKRKFDAINEIIEEKDVKKRHNKLMKLHRKGRSTLGFWVPFFIALGDLLIILYLSNKVGWEII